MASPTRSYLFGSALDLRGPFLVLIHELQLNSRIEDHLYLQASKTAPFERLLLHRGNEGRGVISPDGRSAAVELAEVNEPTEYRISIVDLKSRAVRKHVVAEKFDGREWETLPAWAPDSQEVLFKGSS